MNEPKPVLRSGKIYVAYDMFVCADYSCAGDSALYTGRTTGGKKVTGIGPKTAILYVQEMGGEFTCECGALTMTNEAKVVPTASIAS